MHNGDRRTFISLFCGCGGLDLGFQQAGMKCIGAYDIDPVAIEHYNRNFQFQANHVDLAKGTACLPRERPDVVIAGPPCQGFSTAGMRRFDDPRNRLLIAAGKIALHFQPTVFIAENVAGSISGNHKVYWDRLEGLLRHDGYQTSLLICRADRMGLAQLRKRVILIAWRNRRSFRLSLPYSAPSLLRDTLTGIESTANHEPVHWPKGTKIGKIAAHIQQGQKLSNVRGGDRSVHTWDIPEVFGPTTVLERRVLEGIMRIRRTERRRATGDADPVRKSSLERHVGISVDQLLDSLLKKKYIRRIGKRYDLCHTYNGKFRRLRWDDVALTVDTRFGDPRLFLHPSENRGFTVREAARIQGFPDTYMFYGNLQDQFRVIGNAVPPPVAKSLASFIEESVLR